LGKKALSNTVDEDILSQFKAACALNKKPMNVVLEELLKDYIEETEEKKKSPE
jgi:DNA-binding FrmR family transcriptional regulator